MFAYWRRQRAPGDAVYAPWGFRPQTDRQIAEIGLAKPTWTIRPDRSAELRHGIDLAVRPDLDQRVLRGLQPPQDLEQLGLPQRHASLGRRAYPAV
jgi:hypothetical protein